MRRVAAGYAGGHRRPRSGEADRAILDATLKLLTETSISASTVEASEYERRGHIEAKGALEIRRAGIEHRGRDTHRRRTQVGTPFRSTREKPLANRRPALTTLSFRGRKRAWPDRGAPAVVA